MRRLLAAGVRVAAAVARPYQVERLRAACAHEHLLVSVVAPGDAQAAAGLVKGARDALGGLSGVVAAATMLRRHEPGREPAGDLQELLDANLHRNADLVRAALPSLRRTGRGRLLFLAGPLAADAAALSATTRASLAALRGFADGVAADLADSHVTVEVAHGTTRAVTIDEQELRELVRG